MNDDGNSMVTMQLPCSEGTYPAMKEDIVKLLWKLCIPWNLAWMYMVMQGKSPVPLEALSLRISQEQFKKKDIQVQHQWWNADQNFFNNFTILLQLQLRTIFLLSFSFNHKEHMQRILWQITLSQSLARHLSWDSWGHTLVQ